MTSPPPGSDARLSLSETSHDWHQSLPSEICTSAARARIKNAVPAKEQKSCGDKDTTSGIEFVTQGLMLIFTDI
jgi:hypothetical protein